MRHKVRLGIAIGIVALGVEGIGLFIPEPAEKPASSRGIHQLSAIGLSPETGAIFDRSCKDCHSHATTWPWYSRLQPIRMLIQHDVNAGCEHLDFSTWGGAPSHHRPSHNQLQEICDAVSEGSMPPRRYRLLHPKAALSSS